MTQLKKGLRFIKELSCHFSRDLSAYFYKGWQAGLTSAYSVSFLRTLIFYLNQFRLNLHRGGIEQHHIFEEKIQKLRQTALGLHAILGKSSNFSYSILLVADSEELSLLRRSICAALDLSAPVKELLVALRKEPSPECAALIEELKDRQEIRFFSFFDAKDEKEVVNQLAREASGQFLFLLGSHEWVRPDLLLRFEQTLRMHQNREKCVLYSYVNQINDKGFFVPESEEKIEELHFPYIFHQPLPKSFLIPQKLWHAAGGISTTFAALLLELDLLGASFQLVPFALYSMRYKFVKPAVEPGFIDSLKTYGKAKGLDWEWSRGLTPYIIAAKPQLPPLSVHAIIPFRDQKELTLRCVASLLKQKNVQLSFSAIDNQSQDKTIGETIEKLGGELLFCHEPFNYSRLNNQAVRETKSQADVLLFLNNDVELEEHTVCEMLRWIDQPAVGLVGCRLHYPDGRLQHAGVRLNPYSREEMRWEHVEKLRSFEEAIQAKKLGFFDAVTAACAMIKKELFLKVGGFDEVWYPIGYSDTDLAIKVSRLGLRSFYTPYAAAIHHESVSRKSSIEDVESSWWLYKQLAR